CLREKDRDHPSRAGPSAIPADTAENDGTAGADTWLVTEKPDVRFDRIAGMTAAKNAIFEMIIYPLQAPDKARKLKLPLGGGILLYGPPGTGKTTLARAAANELDADFFFASGAEIRSKWHGESEQRLRALINAARARPVSILFLDDIDGLLPRRSGKSVVDNRIVVQFLNEVGGFRDSDNVLLILGATNCPWEIDEAVFRTGRFDEKIYVGLPDPAARRGILEMHLDGVPVEDGLDLDAWAARLDGYTGSDIVGIVNAAKRVANGRSVRQNTDPVLLAADFEAASRNIPSSAPASLLKKYEAFRRTRFR
ncbi:MAG: ATP-binding protein, partial [Kiritimatiellaeota bacterium]|nr:ATP-binding protein [Kiritimatiellota bacterium]